MPMNRLDAASIGHNRAGRRVFLGALAGGVLVSNRLQAASSAEQDPWPALAAQIFRTVASGSGNDNNSPGSLEQQQIFPKFDDIFRVQGVEAIIQDDPDAGSGGKILAQFENVKTASYNFNVASRSIVGQNVSFVTTMMKDESELSPT